MSDKATIRQRGLYYREHVRTYRGVVMKDLPEKPGRHHFGQVATSTWVSKGYAILMSTFRALL